MPSRRFCSFVCALIIIFFSFHALFASKADEIKKRSFELINEGVSLYNKGQYWDAAQRLEQATNIALNSFLAHYYLGLSLHASRRYAEAIEPLKIALDLNPKHIQAHIALGDTYLKLGDHEEALAEYYRALSISQNYAPAYDGIGRYYESIANTGKAIENFKKAIELNKGYAEAYLHMGDLYLREDNLDEAIRYLGEAVDIRPDFPDGLNRLGTAYAKLKLYDKAMIAIRKAIELAPREASHYEALGNIFLELRQLEQAASLFEKALSYDDSMAEAFIGLAEVNRLKGDYPSAAAMLAKAGEGLYVDSQIRLKIEELKSSYEAEERSLDNLQRQLDAETIDTEKMRSLAGIFASRGDYASAASILSRSPELSLQKEIMEEYGFYLLKAGKPAEAGKILEEVITKFGPKTKVLINIGIACSDMGDPEKAAELFTQVLQQEPDNLHAILYLANSQLRMGKLDEAAQSYERYIAKGGSGPDAERVKRIIELLKDRTE